MNYTTTYTTNWCTPIEVSLTTQSFSAKPSAEQYPRLQYQTQSLSIQDYIHAISREGRGYCAVMQMETFSTKDKRRSNIRHTQVITIDIDGTHLYESDVYDITTNANLAPSLILPSWSHRADSANDRRYHLIYIFNQPLSVDEADHCTAILYQELYRLLGEGVDSCSTDIAHLYNGSRYDEYITSRTSFGLADDDAKMIQIYTSTHFEGYEVDSELIRPRISYSTTQPRERQSDDTTTEREIPQISPQMERDIADLLDHDNPMDWRMFTRTYNRLRLIYRTEPNRWEGMLHKIDPDKYVRLTWPRRKMADGDGRYKWLRSRAVIRMGMYYDDISYEELVYNYVYDLYRFCAVGDIYEDKYTPSYILSACASVWSESREYIMDNLEKYRTSKYNRVPKSGLITQRGLRTQSEIKALKLEVVRACFDPSMSYKDNLAIANETLADEYEDMGIKIANLVNYKEYLKELGLSNMETRQTTKAQQGNEMISKIMEVYDWSKSVRANHTDLKALGIAISRQRLNELVRSVQTDSCVA